MHQNYLDQLFLNRLDSDISIVSGSSPAIEVSQDKAVWPAPDDLKKQIEELNSQGRFSRTPGKPQGSYELMVARIGIKSSAIKRDEEINAGTFSLSQLRLICKRRGFDEDPLAGKGQNVYPVGYLKTTNELEIASKIEVERNAITGNASSKEIDFVFAVPRDYVPVLVEFKLNSVVQIPTNAILTDASQAPSTVDFNQSSENRRPDNNPPPDSEVQGTPNEEQGQTEQRPQELNNNPPEQNRVENLTESITGVQLESELEN